MLKNKCLLLVCFLFFCVAQFGFSQTFVKGLVLTEDNVPMENVLIYNIKTDKKTSTNSEGFFSIEANINDELRFVKDGYERISVKIVNFQDLKILLVKKAVEIEKVYVHKITGNLKEDLKKIKIDHSAEQLQREIGLPKVDGKQREKVPSGFSLNPLVWYSILSGKSKQKENLYKYEDLEENVKWIRDRIEDDYFTSLNIPKERISELLEYAIRTDTSITSDIKMNNVEKIRFDLEKHIQIFLSRLKATKK